LLFLLFLNTTGAIFLPKKLSRFKNLDADFESYKRISLEKQQKLGRELQDEKNRVQKLNKSNQK